MLSFNIFGTRVTALKNEGTSVVGVLRQHKLIKVVVMNV